MYSWNTDGEVKTPKGQLMNGTATRLQVRHATTGRPARVIVVGSITRDVVVDVAGLPGVGETASALAVRQEHGGEGANQAVAAARYGAEVHLIGAVGDDPASTDELLALAAEDVGTEFVQHVTGARTGVATVITADRGDKMIFRYPGANSRLEPKHVQNALDALGVSQSDVCLIGVEVPLPAAEKAAETAAERGARIIVNPAPAVPLSDALIAVRPITTPNATEFYQLCEAHHVEQHPAVFAQLTQAPVLVTRGADGISVATPDGCLLALAAPRVQLVDSTGAGDTLTGVLAARLAEGTALAKAAGEAVLAASRSVTARGARAGMPYRPEIVG